MKKILFAFTLFTMLFASITFALPTTEFADIRVDEATIENGDNGPVLVITGSFPAGTPLEVVLSSAGMKRVVLRERSDDGRKIVIKAKDIPGFDESNLRVSVHIPGESHIDY